MDEGKCGFLSTEEVELYKERLADCINGSEQIEKGKKTDIHKTLEASRHWTSVWNKIEHREKMVKEAESVVSKG